MIDPKLTTFLTLCETKSFTKTAEILYVTQPSVTHHIKMLEKYYNVKLLNSTNKNFALTKEGELLYEYALNLTTFDEEFERVIEDRKNDKKRIIFAVTKAINKAYLSSIISAVKALYNDYTFTINVENYDVITNDIIKGKIDFAIIDNNFPTKRFNALPLLKTKLLVAVGKNHHLAESKKITFEKMLKEELILDLEGSGKREYFAANLKLKNHDLKEFENLLEVNDPLLTIKLVSNGEGISIFYEAEIADEIKNGTLIPLEITDLKESFEFNLIYSKYHFEEAKVQKIAQDLQKIYRECNYLKYLSS